MRPRRLGVRRALVAGRWIDGDVSVVDGRVGDVGLPAGPSARGSATPGFVDVQVNGFAGVSFGDCDVAGHRRAAEAIASSGVTSSFITVPTAAPDRYESILGAASATMAAGQAGGARPLGVHLEGPFLARPGAHPRQHLRLPDLAACADLLARAPVRLMTLAPELPGAFELIDLLHRRGIVCAIGHTEADAATTHRAVDAGATAVTHLWNAMAQPTSRAPGVVGVALARREVSPCLIADLIHVAPEIVVLTMRAAAGRVVVVTDASPYAGLAPTDQFATRATRHADGAVRLADGTLAGSSSTLADAVRHLVAHGVALTDAIHAVTVAPATLLGEAQLGRLCPGGAADVTVLDDDLAVREVLVAGIGR